MNPTRSPRALKAPSKYCHCGCGGMKAYHCSTISSLMKLNSDGKIEIEIEGRADTDTRSPNKRETLRPTVMQAKDAPEPGQCVTSLVSNVSNTSEQSASMAVDEVSSSKSKSIKPTSSKKRHARSRRQPCRRAKARKQFVSGLQNFPEKKTYVKYVVPAVQTDSLGSPKTKIPVASNRFYASNQWDVIVSFVTVQKKHRPSLIPLSTEVLYSKVEPIKDHSDKTVTKLETPHQHEIQSDDRRTMRRTISLSQTIRTMDSLGDGKAKNPTVYISCNRSGVSRYINGEMLIKCMPNILDHECRQLPGGECTCVKEACRIAAAFQADVTQSVLNTYHMYLKGIHEQLSMLLSPSKKADTSAAVASSTALCEHREDGTFDGENLSLTAEVASITEHAVISSGEHHCIQGHKRKATSELYVPTSENSRLQEIKRKADGLFEKLDPDRPRKMPCIFSSSSDTELCCGSPRTE
ncbi:uncharacterized protein LOC106158034 [Lingula anatina]|uniref:Uncharacterized protein LOC106158034 n=1 Tax=Lingula anatina TaxID=7574 RepID=A0A2R2MNW3_LINAN|nr:uncharacterized protein LOC106158034 [Lingula anatina]XP_023931910.1 uncharacterized protein LOC106158034 [Lingula anatina]XP_023931911.1 uncharacterized protein LOC106158034 [Lingula anatina]|eukprot:XP_023931909.1 uncharacterized protein LOC106158034 [Lingula anatina]